MLITKDFLVVQKQQRLLDLFQDYAKNTADNGTVSVLFVSSEGRVPRCMVRKLITFIDYYVLIKYYREKLVVKKWGYHRN